MDLKQKLDSLCDLILETDNEVSIKLSEIRGLYTAYVIAPNEIILNKILEGLVDVVEFQNKRLSLKEQANKPIGVSLNGDLIEFYTFLIEQGKKHTTADNYRKIIVKMAREEYQGIENLNNKISDAIKKYDGNDAAFHNMHIAALRQYEKYLNNKQNTGGKTMNKVYDLNSEKICVEVFLNNKDSSKSKKDLAEEVILQCPNLTIESVQMKMQNIAALCEAYNVSYSVHVTPMKNWSKQNETVFKNLIFK